MATGFHGFHVIIGTIFLAVCLWRGRLGHFTKDHHFGFEAAAWYWHFVDVVWLFLFAAIANLACALQAFIFVYLSITSRYLGPAFQCSCIPISSSKYKKDTFSFDVVMHFPFQLRSITSSCPSGAFFRYSHFWLLYGFRIGSDRIMIFAAVRQFRSRLRRIGRPWFFS